MVSSDARTTLFPLKGRDYNEESKQEVTPQGRDVGKEAAQTGEDQPGG